MNVGGAIVAAASALLVVAPGCAREPHGASTIVPVASETRAPKTTAPSPPPAPAPTALPEYLSRLEKDGDLYERDAGSIVDAPPADVAVLRTYPRFADKGPETGVSGDRLTILTAKTIYAVGEEVRVVHVHEVLRPGVTLYVMGPIFGEYVDGALASPAAAAPPAPYDGAVRPSPGEDHNYEVSVHRLAKGTHTIQWRFATLSGPTVIPSNVLRIEVR